MRCFRIFADNANLLNQLNMLYARACTWSLLAFTNLLWLLTEAKSKPDLLSLMKFSSILLCRFLTVWYLRVQQSLSLSMVWMWSVMQIISLILVLEDEKPVEESLQEEPRRKLPVIKRVLRGNIFDDQHYEKTDNLRKWGRRSSHNYNFDKFGGGEFYNFPVVMWNI